MRPFKKWLLIPIIAAALLLSSCISPAAAVEKCTVLFEANENLYISHSVLQVTRFSQVSVTVGVPHGQRIASVNYENYSVSAKTSQSQSYDYYTVTLYQIRYSTVIRFTTAAAYTTSYHSGETTGEAITITEESPHLFFNTLPYREQFRRDGYVPVGWNTEPDGSGIQVGFGSRIDRRDISHLDLYMQWFPASPEKDFVYETENGEVTITGYQGSGDVVIPSYIGGLPVTAIAQGAFGDLTVDNFILPPTMQTVAASAFGHLTAEHLYFFDSIATLDEECFRSYSIGSVHIQAVCDPVYSGSYFDTFADKMDYLQSLAESPKMVLFGGSSVRFGYDSTMLEQELPEYRVVNMGVYAYSNMLPQAELILQQMQAGDLLLSSPELDAIDYQFCGSTVLGKEIFCMVESNYDLFSRLNCRNYTNVFGAFHAYSISRQNMPARSYLESASSYDEDGNRQLSATYNIQGDYVLYRSNNMDGKAFGIKRAYYNPNYITQADLDGLNRVYDAFASKGVTVFFTYSPRSSVSISDDSNTQSIQALDTLLRSRIHATVISSIEDSLMDPYYFYGTDNHLSTEGVRIHTQKVIEDLQNALK